MGHGWARLQWLKGGLTAELAGPGTTGVPDHPGACLAHISTDPRLAKAIVPGCSPSLPAPAVSGRFRVSPRDPFQQQPAEPGGGGQGQTRCLHVAPPLPLPALRSLVPRWPPVAPALL